MDTDQSPGAETSSDATRVNTRRQVRPVRYSTKYSRFTSNESHKYSASQPKKVRVFGDDDTNDETESTYQDVSFEDEFLDGANDEFEDEESDERSECSYANEDHDVPLYKGHSLTLRACILLIWTFVLKHSLSGPQFSDLLVLINLLLPDQHDAFRSVYMFKKSFEVLSETTRKHFFCLNCFARVDEKYTLCPTPECKKSLENKKSKDYFIHIPMIDQIKNFFAQTDFCDKIKYARNRTKKNSDNIEDIYDGARYKSMLDSSGPLAQAENISFTMNTDGVPIFKSSNKSIWPVYLMINELPFILRKQRKYMLLCGLWFSAAKPVMNIFLEPIVQELIQLAKGVTIKIANIPRVIRGYVIAVSSDIPARSALMNVNQHNGESSCPMCTQTGVNYRTATGGNVRIFPYQQEDPTGPERTHDQVKHDAKIAIETQQTINGVKGPSILMNCPGFDLVKNVSIDYMHALLLGTVRLLLRLWFTSSFSSESFSLYRYVDVIDEKIKVLRPNHNISRVPRTIRDHLKFWKASEIRSWLYLYSIPCMYDIMDREYFYHYCTLVEAMFLLSSSSISNLDLERSNKMINYFVFMLSSLYGDRYLTINIHSLLHLPQLVRELGPVWATSCFSFENANGELTRMFHGTQYIDLQLGNAVQISQKLPFLSDMIAFQNSKEIFQKMIGAKSKRDITAVLGKSYVPIMSTGIKKAMEYFSSVTSDILYYKRAMLNGMVIYSIDYKRMKTRNSLTIMYKSGDIQIGQVKCFISCDGRIYVCVKEMSKSKPPFSFFNDDENIVGVELQSISVCTSTDRMSIIPLESILQVCNFFESDKLAFSCIEPNSLEMNL